MTPGEIPVTLIRPARGWLPLNLGELWEYRDLLYFLMGRDVKLRYTQTALGVAWKGSAHQRPLAEHRMVFLTRCSVLSRFCRGSCSRAA